MLCELRHRNLSTSLAMFVNSVDPTLSDQKDFTKHEIVCVRGWYTSCIQIIEHISLHESARSLQNKVNMKFAK